MKIMDTRALRFPLASRLIWVGLIVGLGALGHTIALAAPQPADATTGATMLAPPPPTLMNFDSTSTMNGNTVIVGPQGGDVSITFSAVDPAAAMYPGSLKVGTMSGTQCIDANTTNKSLPAGSTLSVTSTDSSHINGTFLWSVPAGSPPTAVTFCAYNQFWIIQTGQLARQRMTIVAGSPAKSVITTRAVYLYKKGVLRVKGRAVPVVRKATNGISVTVQDGDGQTLGEGTVKGTHFNVKLSISYIPEVVQSIVVTTPSNLATVKIKGRPACRGECIEINSKPQILGANLNQVWSYKIYAKDTKGMSLTYSLIDPPSGATMDPATGAMTFLSATSGVFNFAVSISSTTGISATQQFQVTICPLGSYWMDGMGGMCM